MDSTKAAEARRKARALAQDLRKLGAEAWGQEQAQLHAEYEQALAQMAASGGTMKSVNGWVVAPGTKLLVKNGGTR